MSSHDKGALDRVPAYLQNLLSAYPLSVKTDRNFVEEFVEPLIRPPALLDEIRQQNIGPDYIADAD